MKTLFALCLLLTVACSADGIDGLVARPAPNSLDPASGLCGGKGQTCCLQQDFPYNSLCADGAVCVGEDLGCDYASGADGYPVTDPACGKCGDPEKKYKEFCTEDPPAPGVSAPADQTAYVFVEKECQLESRCGYIDPSPETLAACIQFFDILASGRCGTAITSSDAKIDECFAEMESFTCTADPNVRPSVCEMLFFSNQKAAP